MKPSHPACADESVVPYKSTIFVFDALQVAYNLLLYDHSLEMSIEDNLIALLSDTFLASAGVLLKTPLYSGRPRAFQTMFAATLFVLFWR